MLKLIRKSLGILAVCSVAILFAGCVNTVDDRKTVGVPGLKDRIEGRYERPVEQVFKVAKEVLKFNGVLIAENTINHSLEARAGDRRIWVRVEEVDAKVSLVIVQARTKGGAADIDLAHEIEKQVALKLQ